MVRRLGITVLGQSNEAGSGDTIDIVRCLGTPLIDPVFPNGQARRSMWPRLSELMAARGVLINVYNSAVGGTSLAKQWCGQPVNWQSGMIVRRGVFVLSGGKLWKCDVALSSEVASTTQPTGTADTTGADSIPWLYLGTPTASDVANQVLVEGDTHFDPLGLISAAYSGISSWVGYDEKWCIISFGQTDFTLGTTRAGFSASIISATNYMLTRNVKVAIGLSCYDALSGADAWYTAQLAPGRQDALDYFVGNSNVVAGASLRTALGVLPVSPAFGLPGLRSDSVHMNDHACLLASQAWSDAFLAAGR